MFQKENAGENLKGDSQSHYIVNSISLNNSQSGVKSSNSKPLMLTSSESLNNLQLSLSSNRSIRSNTLHTHQAFFYDQSTQSYVGNKSVDTSSRSGNRSLKQHEVQERKFIISQQATVKSNEVFLFNFFYQSSFSKLTERKLTSEQLTSPVQEKFQSKASEFLYDQNNYQNRLTQRGTNSKELLLNKLDLSEKVGMLLSENDKLIRINDELIDELESVKRQSNRQVQQNEIILNLQQLAEELTNDNNSLLMDKKQLHQIQCQQKEQIKSLTDILNQRAFIQSNVLAVKNQEFIEKNRQLEQKIEMITEKYHSISKQNQLFMLEMERVLQEKNALSDAIQQIELSKKNHETKLNILLEENGKLNNILAHRLEQIDSLFAEIGKRDSSHEKETIQRIEQEKLIRKLQQHQNECQQEKQDELAKQLLESRKKECFLNQMVVDFEQNILNKNTQLQNQATLIEEKWKQKCQVFESQMKSQYSHKINSQLQLYIKDVQPQFNQAVLQYNTTIQHLQAQIQFIQSSNSEKYKTNEQQWLQERDYLINLIQDLHLKVESIQAEHQNLSKQNLQLKQAQNSKMFHVIQQQSHLRVQTEGDGFNTTQEFKSKLNMINQNKEFNYQIKQKCYDIINQDLVTC